MPSDVSRRRFLGAVGGALAGKLCVVGAVCDIATGRVRVVS